MTENARFTRMDQSSREEWVHIGRETVALQASVPARILGLLRDLKHIHGGFGVDQLHHALQTATMARRDNASDEVVLAALCHDIGKAISIPNHAAIGAELLKPYVSRDVYEVLRTHQEFQGRHYFEYFGASTTLRERHRSQPWFALAEKFTDEWDQAAFDPAYPVLPLEEFEPLVNDLMGRYPYAM